MKTMRALRSPLAAVTGSLAMAVAGCGEVREATVHAADWELDVRPVLETRCAACHAGDAPAAGWSVAQSSTPAAAVWHVVHAVAPAAAAPTRTVAGRAGVPS